MAALETLVAEVLARFDPEAATRAAAEAAEKRDVRIIALPHSPDGLAQLDGVVDAADADDFDGLVAEVAHQLLLTHPDAPLGVRRALALGYIGRGQSPDPQPSAPARPRQAVVYVHLSETAVRGAGGLARVERRRTIVDADRVREWLDLPGAAIVVKPVLDLAEQLATGSYEILDRFRDQAVVRDVTGVFPWCSRDARACDVDHVVPFEVGGPTTTDNLACLCRRHHRLKTHHPGWTYEVLSPGRYRWTSPHGRQYLRDHTGTRQVE